MGEREPKMDVTKNPSFLTKLLSSFKAEKKAKAPKSPKKEAEVIPYLFFPFNVCNSISLGSPQGRYCHHGGAQGYCHHGSPQGRYCHHGGPQGYCHHGSPHGGLCSCCRGVSR
jgi:hypothetical protein